MTVSAPPPPTDWTALLDDLRALLGRDVAQAHARALELGATAEAAGAEAVRLEAALLGLQALYRLSRYGEALDHGLAHLQQAQAGGHASLAARFANLLGLTCLALADYPAALEHFQSAVRAAEAAGDAEGVVRPLLNTALVHHAQRDYPAALATFRDALPRLTLPGDVVLRAQMINNTAQTLWDQGQDLAEAARLFAEAADLKRGLADRWSYALTLCNLAGVQRDLGRFAEAGRTLDEVRACLDGEASAERWYFYHLTRGVWLSAEGNPARDPLAACAALRTALELAQSFQARELEARAGEFLSQALGAAGDWAAAWRALDEAARLRQDLHRDETARRVTRLRVAFDAERARVEAAAERRRREETEALVAQVQEQNDRLTALNREKSAIIGLISHDLRAPLHASHQLAGLLASSATESAADARSIAHGARAMQDGIARMLDLVETLLDIEALESGTMRSPPQVFAVDELVREEVEARRAAAQAKRIALAVRLPAEPLRWSGARPLLARLLDNLLSNAIKYSPPGRPVEVEAAAAGGRLVLRVADAGPGIAPAQRGRLFQKFATLGSVPTGGETASGLGLHLAQACAVQLGGTLRYEDTPGGGATFVAEFPAADPA